MRFLGYGIELLVPGVFKTVTGLASQVPVVFRREVLVKVLVEMATVCVTTEDVHVVDVYCEHRPDPPTFPDHAKSAQVRQVQSLGRIVQSIFPVPTQSTLQKPSLLILIHYSSEF